MVSDDKATLETMTDLWCIAPVDPSLKSPTFLIGRVEGGPHDGQVTIGCEMPGEPGVAARLTRVHMVALALTLLREIGGCDETMNTLAVDLARRYME